MYRSITLKSFLHINRSTGLYGHLSPISIKENMHISRPQGALKEDQLFGYTQAALQIQRRHLAFASRAMALAGVPLLELVSLYKSKNNPSTAAAGNMSPLFLKSLYPSSASSKQRVLFLKCKARQVYPAYSSSVSRKPY